MRPGKVYELRRGERSLGLYRVERGPGRALTLTPIPHQEHTRTPVTGVIYRED